VAEQAKPNESRSGKLPSPEFFIALTAPMLLLGLYGKNVDIGQVALFAGVLVAVGGAIASVVRWQNLTTRGRVATAILAAFALATILLLFVPML